jgi:small subunit ribosomal protein S17
MNKPLIQKTQIATIVSDKMQGTAVVEVEIWKTGRIIKKRYKRHSRFMVDNPNNTYHTGERVKIVETKPLSRHKRWQITGKAKKEDI